MMIIGSFLICGVLVHSTQAQYIPEEELSNDPALSCLQKQATIKGERAHAVVQMANADDEMAAPVLQSVADCATGQVPCDKDDTLGEVQIDQDGQLDTALLSFLSVTSHTSNPVSTNPEGTHARIEQQILYFGSMILLAIVITLIYWPLGAGVILRILAYLLTGCTVTLTVKLVYSAPVSLHYPRLLTTCHLVVSAALGFGILFYRRLSEGKSIQIPTVPEFIYKLLPLCLGMSYSLGCSNMALVYCSVSFAAIIGASTPFFSVLLMVVLGMPFNWFLILPVSGIVFGCMMTISGTLQFSLYGLFLVLMGNLGRAIKAVLQQWIMTGEVKDKYDPVTLLSWQCLICTPLMLAWTAMAEGAPAFKALFMSASPGVVFAFVLLSCVNAAALNALHIFVIKDLGAIGIQATSQLKQALTVLGGVVVFGDSFTALNVMGGLLVLASAFWYTRVGSGEKKKEQKAEETQSSEDTQSNVKKEDKVKSSS